MEAKRASGITKMLELLKRAAVLHAALDLANGSAAPHLCLVRFGGGNSEQAGTDNVAAGTTARCEPAGRSCRSLPDEWNRTGSSALYVPIWGKGI
jgi:hypothetical protein